MNAIQRFVVRAQHWQLFAILVGSVCLAEIVLIDTYPKGDNVMIPTSSLMAAELCWICFVLWFWSLGEFLYSATKPDLRLRLSFFRFALVYPLVYMALFQLVFEKLTPVYITVIFPFHLLELFCIAFNLNFVSKSLVLAERGRAVSFADYAGPFFLLGFFPLGIWFVQPRINHLYAATLSQQTA